jgi:hypothetical protein
LEKSGKAAIILADGIDRGKWDEQSMVWTDGTVWTELIYRIKRLLKSQERGRRS